MQNNPTPDLPLSIWIHVGECLDTEQDIFSLARTSSWLYRALRPVLYRHDAEHGNSSALLWAAENGIESVARYAISLGADVNVTNDEDEDMPLHLAARHGHESIIALLLQQSDDADPDERNRLDETPLICAASHGHGTVVRQLLGVNGVDPNARQINIDCGIDQSALQIAVSEGFLSVVEAMLDHKSTDLDCEDTAGCTPLGRAASIGDQKIVRLLLESGRAEVNQAWDVSNSPLFLAAQMGHAACVAMLLQDPRVDAKLRDDYGRSAFDAATASGHTAVVQAFLQHRAVDPDTLDSDSNSLLAFAAKFGDPDLFKELWNAGNIQLDMRNSYGQTLLIVASEGGTLEIVKLVMETGAIDANCRADGGETAFLMAVAKGHLAVVEFFVQGGLVDMHLKDASGASALAVAAANGHLHLVNYFLDRHLFDVCATDDDGDTVLSVAASEGHLGILKRCLESRKIDINARNANGWTVFMWACYGGHLDTVEFLLELPEVDRTTRDLQGRTPLHAACMHTAHRGYLGKDHGCIGNVQVLKLLEKHEGDMLCIDDTGCTPLHTACASGCFEIILWLAYNAAAVHAKDNNGRTPYFHACIYGKHDAESLLDRHTKTRDEGDVFGNVPILVATRNGHDNLVRSMLTRRPLLLLYKDAAGRTLFHWAARQQNRKIIGVLKSVYNKDEEFKVKVDDELGVDVDAALATNYPPSELLLPWTDGCEWCHVCCRVIGDEIERLYCRTRNGASFAICLECKGQRHRCRDETHNLASYRFG